MLQSSHGHYLPEDKIPAPHSYPKLAQFVPTPTHSNPQEQHEKNLREYMENFVKA